MPRPLSKHSKAYPRKGNDRPKTTSVRSSSRAETRRAERNDKILPPVNKSEVRAHHSKMIAQFQAMLRPIRKPKRGVPTIASPEPLENYFYFNGTTHYATLQTPVFIGGFQDGDELRVTVNLADKGGNQRIFSSFDDGMFLQVFPTGTVRFRYTGTDQANKNLDSPVPLVFGQESEIIIRRAGGIMEFELYGSVRGNNSLPFVFTQAIAVVGAKGDLSGNFAQGVIKNIQYRSVLAPEPSIDWPMEEGAGGEFLAYANGQPLPSHNMTINDFENDAEGGWNWVPASLSRTVNGGATRTVDDGSDRTVGVAE